MLKLERTNDHSEELSRIIFYYDFIGKIMNRLFLASASASGQTSTRW